MRHEQVELEGDGYAGAPGLATGRIGGDHDLSHERQGGVRRLEGEGQHIGAAPHGAKPRVETTDLLVADDGDLDQAGGTPDSGQRPVGDAGQARGGDRHAPLTILDRRRHQDRAEEAPSSGRASCAPYARMIADTSR